jgi:hypothetical protein
MNMYGTRQILVDSSTKWKKRERWGESAVCWAVFDALERGPEQVGIVYLPHSGPNRIFIIGVLNRFAYCLSNSRIQYILDVRGDCNCAIDVLTGKWQAHNLRELRDKARALEGQLLAEKKVIVQYSYIPRTTDYYKPIDKCARQAANFIHQKFATT